MRFEHRGAVAGAGVVDRVWRTSSDTEATMISAARTCCQLVFTRMRGRLLVSLRGPETRATVAPVPPDAEFLGVRLALGVGLRPHPVSSIVDADVTFPVTDSGRILIAGEDLETPTYDNVEQFVGRLQQSGLLVRTHLDGAGRSSHRLGARPSRRTVQRRYQAITGLSRTAVTQIDRANAAATMLRDGVDWRPVVAALGFFDQAHLAHALRRYVGFTAGGLRAGDEGTMSFLYKISAEPGS